MVLVLDYALGVWEEDLAEEELAQFDYKHPVNHQNWHDTQCNIRQGVVATGFINENEDKGSHYEQEQEESEWHQDKLIAKILIMLDWIVIFNIKKIITS